MALDGTHPRQAMMMHAVAGVEAGVCGGVVMLLWFASVSLWRREPWWAFPNLMASGFYGDAVFHLGPGAASWAGVALLLVLAGSLGAAFGVAAPARVSPFRFGLLALAASLVWLYLTLSQALNHWAPLVPLYVPKASLCVGHVAYGLALASQRRCYRRLAQTFGLS